MIHRVRRSDAASSHPDLNSVPLPSRLWLSIST